MLALRGRRAELSAPVKVQDISEHPFPGLPPKWYTHTQRWIEPGELRPEDPNVQCRPRLQAKKNHYCMG